MKHLLALVAVLSVPHVSYSASIVWGAINGNGNYVATSSGTTMVPDGTLFRLGWFEDSYFPNVATFNANVQAAYQSPAGLLNLEANFHEIASDTAPASILGAPRAGAFGGQIDYDADAAGAVGKQLVILAYLASDYTNINTTISTLQEFGVFYFDASSDPDNVGKEWTLPSDLGGIPGTISLDLGQLNGVEAGPVPGLGDLITGAQIPVGRYSGGSELNQYGARSFVLAVIPEPTTAGLIGLAVGMLALRRRRRA